MCSNNHESTNIKTLGPTTKAKTIFRWKVTAYIPISLRSTMGPIATKASFAPAGKVWKEAATKASASEQTDKRIAKIIIPMMDSTRFPVKKDMMFSGNRVLKAAAAMAPMMRNFPMSINSWAEWTITDLIFWMND